VEYAARGVRVPAPKLRYGAGHDGRWIPHQKTVIPQRNFDRLLRRSLHLPNPATTKTCQNQRVEPTRMAQDLATTVELLAAAIEAIPADRLNPSDAERLVASRRHLRSTITNC
jgi:hypothetical protein